MSDDGLGTVRADAALLPEDVRLGAFEGAAFERLFGGVHCAETLDKIGVELGFHESLAVAEVVTGETEEGRDVTMLTLVVDGDAGVILVHVEHVEERGETRGRELVIGQVDFLDGEHLPMKMLEQTLETTVRDAAIVKAEAIDLHLHIAGPLKQDVGTAVADVILGEFENATLHDRRGHVFIFVSLGVRLRVPNLETSPVAPLLERIVLQIDVVHVHDDLGFGHLGLDVEIRLNPQARLPQTDQP